MAAGKMGCCMRIQKCSIFLINLVIFLFGVVEIGIALYIKLSKDDGDNFVLDLFEGYETLIEMTLSFGVALTIVAFFGCCGAMMSDLCMLWTYVIFMFFLIMGQAMIFAVGLVFTDYDDDIFAHVWSDLSNDTRLDIESAYDCCSFKGTDVNNTWASDITDYEECSAIKNDSTIVTCWSKFSSDFEAHYTTIVCGAGVIFVYQVMLYFCTYCVMESIARAEKSELDESENESRTEKSDLDVSENESKAENGQMGVQLHDMTRGQSLRVAL